MTNPRVHLAAWAAGLLVLAALAMLPAACTLQHGNAPGVTTAVEPAKTAPSAAKAPPAGVALPIGRPEAERIERLPNGLRVVVRERHVGGVAAFRIYLPAGSLNEAEYAGTGVSHLLEHLVAGGTTANRTEDQIRKALDDIGAQTNAHTSKQFVCYFGESSAEHVDQLIDIIADTVMNAKIEPKEFDREFQVVQRELERSEADPDSRLWRLADETFFLNHPARYPVIGYLDDLKRLTRDDVVKYYRRVAAPDDAVVVAVGDFDANAVFETIRRVMGSWARQPGSPPVLPARERQLAPRRAEVEMDVAAVRAIIEVPSVQLTHPDLYPLDILAFILGEGRSSRLVSDLRDRRGVVQSIECGSFTPAGYDGGRFSIIFEAEPARAEAAREGIAQHLVRVSRELVTPEELARAKRQKISEHVFSLQQCDEIATDVGTNVLLVGDPHFSERYVRNIQNVTAEDVRRVAATYLRSEAVTVTVLSPKPAGKPAEPGAKPESPDAKTPVVATPSRGRPEIIQKTLKNGVRLLLCPMEGQPTVSIQMAMRGGLSVESADTAGTSYLMSRLLLKGTAKRKAADVAAALDAMGAEMNAAAGRNTVYLSARCLADDFEKTFDLASDCLLNPAFAPDEVQKMRDLVASELARLSDTPQGEAMLYFNRVFFTNSPYQYPVQGTLDVLKAQTPERLAAWHHKYVAANNLVVAVFGGVDVNRAAAAVVRAFEALPESKGLQFPADQAPREVRAREVYVKPSEKEAAIVTVAYPGMDIYNLRDRFAMELLDTVVSGYQMPSGWLHEELRGKGLVYEVHAFSMEGLRPGYFAAMAVCQPAKVPEVVEIIEGAMRRATRETFTEEQLAPARATVITAKELGRETVDAWAFEAAIDEVLRLGYNFPREEILRIRQTKAEDVSRVARQYLRQPVISVLTSDPAAAEKIRK